MRGLPYPEQQIRLLADYHLDILLLQDVPPRASDAIDRSGYWRSVVTSVASYDQVRTGCLVGAGSGWRITGPIDVPADVSPSRALATSAVNGCIAVTLVSCYAPTNARQQKKERPHFFDAVATWLSALPAPIILGIDANGPRIDHPDVTRNEWWVPEESSVLGEGALTEDVLRRWYDAHPDARKHRARYYPRGPLADSYHRGRKGRFVRSRYDSIRTSPGVAVEGVRYLYDEAVAAGSDHALVVAVLAVNP